MRTWKCRLILILFALFSFSSYADKTILSSGRGDSWEKAESAALFEALLKACKIHPAALAKYPELQNLLVLPKAAIIKGAEKISQKKTSRSVYEVSMKVSVADDAEIRWQKISSALKEHPMLMFSVDESLDGKSKASIVECEMVSKAHNLGFTVLSPPKTPGVKVSEMATEHAVHFLIMGKVDGALRTTEKEQRASIAVHDYQYQFQILKVSDGAIIGSCTGAHQTRNKTLEPSKAGISGLLEVARLPNVQGLLADILLSYSGFEAGNFEGKKITVSVKGDAYPKRQEIAALLKKIPSILAVGTPVHSNGDLRFEIRFEGDISDLAEELMDADAISWDVVEIRPGYLELEICDR